MISFISESSKFLVFDTGLCRNAMWYRGSYLVPQTAESCTLGETGWFACAAGVVHFWALVCVCLKAPKRRTLDKSFGAADSKLLAGENEVQEKTSDDNDIEGADYDANQKGVSDILEKKEEGHQRNPNSNEISTIDLQGNASDDILAVATNDVSDGRCCSPVAVINNKPAKNMPTESSAILMDSSRERRNSTLSPVDFLIEGFDVATDLSHINVCRTIVMSPTPQPPADRNTTNGTYPYKDADDEELDEDFTEEDEIRILGTVQAQKRVPSQGVQIEEEGSLGNDN